MHFLRPTKARTVSTLGAAADCVLCGVSPTNQGLRLKVLHDQDKGHCGAIRGPFLILDVGDNKHAQALEGLLNRVTDAAEVLAIIRRRHPACVHVVNANILAVQNGEGDPPPDGTRPCS